MIQLLIQVIVYIGAEAGFTERRKVLGEKTVAHLDDGYSVFLVCRPEPVDLVAAVGEDFTRVEKIVMGSVLQQDLSFQNVDKLNILVIVNGIFFDPGDSDIDGKIVQICGFFIKHGTPPHLKL